jgi:DNA-binding PadR family transcriptional regulator
MNDFDRDHLRRIILKLISEGHHHWTDIEKRVCASYLDYATSNTVKRQFYGYLLPSDYVERLGRGRYALTDKGKRLLALLS